MRVATLSWRRAAFAAIAAIALALLSVVVERTGPEVVEYGNLCGPTASAPCYQPVLKAGFPVAFLYDAPGVSVERQLSFGEDKLDTGGLLLNVAIYFGVTMLMGLIVARCRSALRLGSHRD